MAVHLTPLRRSQLLELGKLLELVQHSPSCFFSSPSCSCSNCAAVHPEHPFACGTFCDVFEDPFTRDSWRLYDKMLYIVWWSHRPPCCSECGMRDAWAPSAENEMKCWHCGAGAGTTSGNDIVEDLPATRDEDYDEDDDDSVGNEFANNAAAGGSGGGGGPVTLYMFFYEWLSRLQLMERGKGVVLPAGESLPAVLRAAYDLALLFVTPGLSNDGATVLQGGALYLSLVLHRFPVPFPLFCLAGRVNAADRSRAAAVHTTVDSNGNKSGDCSGGVKCNVAATMMRGEQVEELQWVDVELLAALIGVSLSDFFESSKVAVQYLQNVMTVAAAFAVPSVLWHPQRREGRAEYIMTLRQRRRCLLPLHSTAMSSELSPENTAMIVALELARAFDADTSSPEHAERIGLWLDEHGLYPSRQVYRVTSVKDNNNNNGNNNDNGNNNNNNNNSSLTRTACCDTREYASVVTSFTRSSGDASSKSNTVRVLSGEATKEKGEEEENNDIGWANPLTTGDSPFADSMQLILLSPCANALLYMFASAFSMSALELADMAVRSGIYGGSTRFFDTLRRAAESGNYSLMSLSRRLSPIKSVWTSVYFALHSEDRLPLLTALQHIRVVTTRDKEVLMARIIQRILRKHQASHLYQFNYSIRLTDDSERQQFKGVYFLSYVTRRFAVYVGVRSARKTVTFDSQTGKITLCAVGAKEQQVESLDVQFTGPILVNIETESAKCVIDCVRQSIGAESWQVTVRHLNRCGRVRRRMRVPMLASRLDALASVREATAMASHPVASAATLLGWGETEVLLTALPPVHSPVSVEAMRHELQLNLFSLPKPSLVFGISDNRVIAVYASLVALLEYIEHRVLKQYMRGQQNAPLLSFPRGNYPLTWVDVLLYDEEPDTNSTPVCTQLRSGELSSLHASNNSCMPKSPIQLPVSTAAVKREQAQEVCQDQTTAWQTPQRGREVKAFPTYQEVMLGHECWFNGSGGNARFLSSGRVLRGSQHRDRQQRRMCSQQRPPSDAMNGFGNTLPGGSLSTICSSFNLFAAEECRKRLHRLLHFIAMYTVQQRKLDKPSAAVGSAATIRTVYGETSGNSTMGEVLPTARKEQHSPRLSHNQQQQQQQLLRPPAFQREKVLSRNGVPSIRNGSNLQLTTKPNTSPVIESTQQQRSNTNLHHNHHHRTKSSCSNDSAGGRRFCRSRSFSEGSSEESEQGGRSPINCVVISSALERSPHPRKRSRVRVGSERQSEVREKKSCGRNDVGMATSSLSSSPFSSLRSFSASGSSSADDDNAHTTKRRR